MGKELNVHLGKENSEDYHIIIKGYIDVALMEDLIDLLNEHNYNESL